MVDYVVENIESNPDGNADHDAGADTYPSMDADDKRCRPSIIMNVVNGLTARPQKATS